MYTQRALHFILLPSLLSPPLVIHPLVIPFSRGWLPDPIKAIEWFAPDDASTSPRVPVYGGATRIPAAFGSLVGQTPGGGVPYAPVADGFTMSLESAFWVWNLVGNVAFSERYQVAYPMVTQVRNPTVNH